MEGPRDRGLLFGFYLSGDISTSLEKALYYQIRLGVKINIISYYFSWGEDLGPDILAIEKVIDKGFIPMITWEPWRLPKSQSEIIHPENQPEFALNQILKGNYDEYIQRWAKELRRLSRPIFFRPMHEMNGDWYPWCGTVNGNDPKKFIEVWCYIRDIFKSVGCDKLLWIWSPYIHSVPDIEGNEIWAYYPGSQYLDWLALDGYNWGVTREWSRWQDFNEIFKKGYDILNEISENKPIMIAEIGCAEEGGDKGEWILDAFKMIRNRFLRIKAIVWFNIKKECDWRIESSERSFRLFSEGLKIYFSKENGGV